MNVNEPQQALGLNIPGLRSKEHRATPHPSAPSTSSPSNRLPFLDFLPDGFRNHFIAMSGEFVGTFLFLFFALSGTQVANTKDPTAHVSSAPDPASLLYISLSFGFSLAVNAWLFLRISGGLFNPAGWSCSMHSRLVDAAVVDESNSMPLFRSRRNG